MRGKISKALRRVANFHPGAPRRLGRGMTGVIVNLPNSPRDNYQRLKKLYNLRSKIKK